jgi:SAM-dependent methyltransferase
MRRLRGTEELIERLDRVAPYYIKHKEMALPTHNFRFFAGIDSIRKPSLDILVCGSLDGNMLSLLNSALYEKKVHYTVIDKSKQSLLRNQQVINMLGLSAELTHGSCTEMPYPNESFDAVVSDFLVNYLTRPQLRQTVSEWHRTLRPNGEVYLTAGEKMVITNPSEFLSVGVSLIHSKINMLRAARDLVQDTRSLQCLTDLRLMGRFFDKEAPTYDLNELTQGFEMLLRKQSTNHSQIKLRKL